MALPIGHGLVGIAIAKKTNLNPILAGILAILPDIDFFFGLFAASGNMLAFHRSNLTHNLIFAVFMALIFFLWGHIRKRPYKNRQILGIGLIVASHVLLDNLPLPYFADLSVGKNGFWDFLFTHLISLEGAYNTAVDLAIFGSLYLIVTRFIFKEKKLF